MIDIDTTYVDIMAVNNKPILSILIDDDKRSRFAALAKDNKKSMGWIVNQAIDRMLEANSIEMFLNPVDLSTENNQQASIGVSIEDVKRLIDTSIGNHVKSIENNQQASIGVSVENIEELIKTSVEAYSKSIEKNQPSTELSIEELKSKISEVEASTHAQTYTTHDSIQAQKVLIRQDLDILNNKLDRLTTAQALDITGLHERLCVAELAIKHNRDDIKDLKPAKIDQPPQKVSVNLTITDVIDATGKTRQAIEKLRNEGRLPTIGYIAIKDGRNWIYRQTEMLSKSM